MTSTLTRRTASVVIYQGDDLEHLAELRRAAEHARQQRDNARRTSPLRVGDAEPVEALNDRAEAAEEAYDDAVKDAADRAVEVRLQALPRRKFRTLMLEHPPREVPDEETGRQVEHEEDEPYGINVETFGEALLTYREGAGDQAVKTITVPAFDSLAELQTFLDDLSDGDYERLWTLGYGLNRAAGGDPKDLAYSPERAGSTAT